MWPLMTSITSSSSSARAMKPHSHRMILAMSPSSPVWLALYCHNVGVSLESSHLRIHLCGPLAIERDDQRLDRQIPGRQGRLLFAYLVCNRHRPARRAELIEAIWPDQAPSAADNALNALISKLRRVLGPDALDRRANLQLQLGDAWVDVEAAVEAVHRAESAIAVRDWTRAWGPALVALFIA